MEAVQGIFEKTRPVNVGLKIGDEARKLPRALNR